MVDGSSKEKKPRSELVKGSILDKRFEVLELCGRGALGVVYKCRNLISGEIVAVKVLQGAPDTPDKAAERFMNEARTLAKLNHPGIVTAKSFGKNKDGLSYICMEFLPGDTLDKALKDKRLDNAALQSVMIQVAEALAYAHEQGVVHRDIKPANIMVLPADSKGFQVKLLDLGLAKALEASDSSSSKLTKTGVIAGTPAYMSPERCRAELASPASDLYSYACVLFEVIYGRVPFRGDSDAHVMLQHLNEPVKIPESPGVSKKMKNLLLRCLAKDPAQRYANAGELLGELKLAFNDEPDSAPSKRWSFIAAGALVAIVLLGFAGYSFFFGRNSDAHRTKQNGISQAELSSKLNELEEFSSKIPLTEEQDERGVALIKEYLKRAEPVIMQLDNSNYKHHSGSIKEFVAAHLLLGKSRHLSAKAQEEHFERALQISRQFHLPHCNQEMMAYQHALLIAVAMGKFRLAKSLFGEGLDTCESDEAKISAYYFFAETCLDAGDINLANDLIDKADQLYSSTFSTDSFSVSRASYLNIFRLAYLSFLPRSKQTNAARARQLTQLKEYAHLGHDELGGTMLVCNSIASALLTAGQPQRALECVDFALSLYYLDPDWSSAAKQANLGSRTSLQLLRAQIFEALGNYKKALQYPHAFANQLRQFPGAELQSHAVNCHIYLSAGKPEAQKELDAAIKEWGTSSSQLTKYRQLSCIDTFLLYYIKANQAEKARESAQQILALSRDIDGPIVDLYTARARQFLSGQHGTH